MHKKPTILFIHFGLSSFVKEDIRILKKYSQLRVFHFQASKSPFILFKNFIQQKIWLLRHLHKADVIYCWFSDYHSFLPVLFSKLFKIPSITVLGGFDCNKIEKLDYGIFCSRWRIPLGTFVLKNSNLLLPVDETLIATNRISENWGEAHPNGVKENVKKFHAKWQALPTGYDSTSWSTGPPNRNKTVCTAALCSNLRTALIKGWDLFIQTSKLLPDFEFMIVGASSDVVQLLKEKYEPAENLQFTPAVPREELETIYHQSSVYLQLSRAEGLPNVLCEAMMCGCIPVGSPVFGIPHAIGDTGYIVPVPDPKEITALVELAHQHEKELRPKSRQRIIEQFSLERRERELLEIITEITK